MKTVAFRGAGQAAEIETQQRLLDALLARQVPVKMLCRGRGLCATCHVHVESGADSLTPITRQEKLTLSVLTGARSNSRLACQAKVLSEGVEISLPKGLYAESFSDIEKLIGKRTTTPILHPINGRVLIQAGKIITRSAIADLSTIDLDVSAIVSPG
jgi:ferredoxin